MSLRELSLQGVEDTGREIGKGAYGVVREVNVMGKRWACSLRYPGICFKYYVIHVQSLLLYGLTCGRA